MGDSNFLVGAGADSLAVVIDRGDVERCDVEPTLRVLKRLLEDRSTVEKFRGRVDSAFFGYDDDARELYEIGEVRRFVAELDSKFGYWLYFLNLQSEALAMVVLCLCRHAPGPKEKRALEAGGLERFLMEHFFAVNWLFETFGLDEKENEALTARVMDYFEKRQKPRIVQ